MTLIEVLVAGLVLVVAIAGLVTSLLNIVTLFDISQRYATASSDLRNMMEKVRLTPFDNILTLFPNNDADGPAANPYPDVVGGYTLSNEQITVSYADVNAEPLEFRISISWQDKIGRAYSLTASSFKAR